MSKILKKHSDDEEIALILKDIENAKQGVMTFSKEVKKYMLQFIHARYDDNQEVMSLIEVLRKWSKYETFNFLEIFQLQDECYFGTIFACVRRVESYRKNLRIQGRGRGVEDTHQACQT